MQALKSHITREEYLEIDNSSTGKHEFYQRFMTDRLVPEEAIGC